MFSDDLAQDMPFLDGKGRYRTMSLFFEYNQSSMAAVYTLKPQHHSYAGKDYVSLQQLYLELAVAPIDGEYEFAMAAFGSWEQWQRICANVALRRYIDVWRDELEVKIRSEALKSLVETSRTEGSRGTTAAKWLASGQWKSGKGRPTKAQVEQRKKIEAGIIDETDEDGKRLGLH